MKVPIPVVSSALFVSSFLASSAQAGPRLVVPDGIPKVVSFPFTKVNKNPYNIPYRNRRFRKRADKTILQILDNAVCIRCESVVSTQGLTLSHRTIYITQI